jgi:hypothetical protein
VSDDVLQEPVPPSGAQQIGGNDQHAGRGDPIAIIGYKDVDARVRQSFLPDGLGALSRLRDRTHLRRIEKRKERSQIRGTGEARDGHPGLSD